MSDDHFEELRLIDHSRAQRIALLRWVPVLVDAGISVDEIEEIRRDLAMEDCPHE